jgi:hypothetical protein
MRWLPFLGLILGSPALRRATLRRASAGAHTSPAFDHMILYADSINHDRRIDF